MRRAHMQVSVGAMRRAQTPLTAASGNVRYTFDPAHRSGRSCLRLFSLTRHIAQTDSVCPVLSQLLFDLLQRRWVIDRGQVAGVAVFANRLYGAAQQLAAAGFGQQTQEQTRDGLATAPNWLSTSFMISPSSFSSQPNRPALKRLWRPQTPWPPGLSVASATPTTATSATFGWLEMLSSISRRAQAVTGHIDHIVRAAQNVEITVFIAHAPVERGIHQLAGHALPIGFDKALIVAPQGLQTTRGQRSFDDHHAFFLSAC
jgi:hypothetical protein